MMSEHQDRRIDRLLGLFPKKRPPLTEEMKEIWEKEYLINRRVESSDGAEPGLLYRMVEQLETWGHKQLASRAGKGPILELGPGTLNHVPYEGTDYAYDIVEPNDFFYRESPHKDRIRTIYKDIGEIPKDQRYHRIITKGVLEHIEDLPIVIARSARLLEKGGYFQHAIPSEGGLTWGLAWRFTTGLAFRLRTGINYKQFMRHEHINQASEILELINYFFEDVKLRYFPLPSLHLSFYIYVEAKNPKEDVVEDFIRHYKS